MVNRSDFRPSERSSRGLSEKDMSIIRQSRNTPHHRVAHHKPSQTHVSLEHRYTVLHHKHKHAKTDLEKQKLKLEIKKLHLQVKESRKRMYKDKKNHVLLHKLHGTTTDAQLHKAVHDDKPKPVETHVLRDLGEGIKKVGISAGQLATTGLNRLSEKLQTVNAQYHKEGDVTSHELTHPNENRIDSEVQ